METEQPNSAQSVSLNQSATVFTNMSLSSVTGQINKQNRKFTSASSDNIRQNVR